MLKNKAHVCLRCRKVIVYNATQAGTSLPCPHCGETTNLPADRSFHPEPKMKPIGKMLVVLTALLAIGGTGSWAIFSVRKKLPDSAKTLPTVLTSLIISNKAVAPNTAKAKGVHASISVTEVTYEPQQIFHSALKKTVRTETPVCCIRVNIENTGTTGIPFNSWRIFESLSRAEKAALVGSMNEKFSLASFGVESVPVGVFLKTEIAPGEKAIEKILFLCNGKPATDLTLSLPCSNVGGDGLVYITIPARMIQ